MIARVRFHGPPLAQLITGIINRGISGQVVVESVEWPITSLPTFLTGGWVPVTVRGVRVYDGGPGNIEGREPTLEERTLLIESDYATARIDAHALVFGYPDIVVSDLDLPRGGRVRVEEVVYPATSTRGPQRIISLLAAFRSPPGDGFGAGTRAVSSPIFDLRDYRFKGVVLDCIFPDFDLHVEDVSGQGFLYSDMSEPLTPRLYYALTAAAPRGQLDIKVYLEGRDQPPDIIYDLPLHDVEVARLAQLPTGWPLDSIARDVEWDITGHSEGGATLTTEGAMRGYWDAPHGGDYDLTLTGRHLGPLLKRLSDGILTGDELAADVRVTGPIVLPYVELKTQRLDFTLPLGRDIPPLALHIPESNAWVDLATESGGVSPARAYGADGAGVASIHLELAPFWFDVELEIDQAAEIGPFLGPKLTASINDLGPMVGGTRMRGDLRIIGDGRRLAYDDLSLLMGRMRITGALVQDEDNILHTRAVKASAGDTNVVTQGTWNLISGSVNLGMSLSSGDVERWLRHFDSPPLGSRVDGQARILGTIDAPRACAKMRMLGIPMLDTLAGWFGYRDEVVSLDINKRPSQNTPCTQRSLRRAGQDLTQATPEELAGDAEMVRRFGGLLWATGKIQIGPAPRVLGVEARAQRLSLARLVSDIPLVGELLSGSVSLTATAFGPFQGLDARARASFDDLEIAGEAYRVTSPCPTAGAARPSPGDPSDPDAAGQADDDSPSGVCVRSYPDGTSELAFALTRQRGGELGVSAQLDRQQALRGRVTARALPIDQIARLPLRSDQTAPPVGGQISADLALGGTLSTPLARGYIDARDSFYGNAYLGQTDVDVRALDDDTLRLTGRLLQGDVEVRADIDTHPPYNAEVSLSLRRVELERLAPELAVLLLPAELRADGASARAWLSGDIHIAMPLAGGPNAPITIAADLSEAELVVDLRDTRGRPAPIRLRTDRATPIALRFDGNRAHLSAPVTIHGPHQARFTIGKDASLTLRPEARDTLAAARRSARATVQSEQAQLEQAKADQAHTDDPTATADNTAAALKDELEAGLEAAAPAASISDSIGRLNVDLKGQLDLRFLEPYLGDYVASIAGTVAASASIRGRLDAPKVDLQLEITEALTLKPVRQEATVSLSEGGRVLITNEQLVVSGAAIEVADPFATQTAKLEISGGVRLDNLEPVEWALQVDGDLAGQMLLLLAPEVFSRATGRAALAASVRGPTDNPQLDINLDFASPRPLSVTPRGLGREIRLDRGELELSELAVGGRGAAQSGERAVLELYDISGELGYNGRISSLAGVVELERWEPVDIDVVLTADGLPVRIPQELELLVNVAELRVFGDVRDQIALDGVVEIVDGRYFRRFNLISDVLSLDSGGGGGGGKPFYETDPLLANATLDLLLDVRSFSVQNNLAAIYMSGDLLVTGTPSQPRFDGEIQVSDGEFKLPGARARFTRTWGNVTFAPSKPFPVETPTVSLQSEGDYRDASGQYHLITLSVDGSWRRPEWDLYTSSGLNKGQTFTMLFSGRTPAELRKTLGDESPGGDQAQVDPAVTSDNAADQILKDVAGDFISLLVEDTLRNLTSLDVARIEIGTSSIGFHAEKEVTDKIRVTGDVEQSSTGRTIDVRGEVQLSDKVSLEGGARTRSYTDPAEDSSTDYRFRAVYRRYFLWPW
ncbi:MAG: hypothetical protein Tsb0020_12290 [Haliangiales bacterium]